MNVTWKKVSNFHFMQRKLIRVLLPKGAQNTWNKALKALPTKKYDKLLA